MMLNVMYIFVGGGLGSLCRYYLSISLNQDGGYPVGTLLANLAACLVLGVLIQLQVRHGDAIPMLLLGTGFCGGFSTFSTFSAETLSMLQTGDSARAFAYVAASLLLGLACVWIGYKLGQYL